MFVLLLALLALLAPKAGTDGFDPPKLGLVAGVAPNRDLLSPNVVVPPPPPPALAAPNVRLGGFCVPKVLVTEEMPKVSVAGVAFAPNMGTDAVVLSVEPNIEPVVPPKAGCVACTFVAVPTPGAPNAGVVLFVVSKLGVIVVVETLPVMPNAGAGAGAVGPVCVVEPNNGAVVLPNMPLAVPKDVDGFVWPKIGAPLPNTGGAAVVEAELALTLENKLELGVLPDDDTTLVVETKIEEAAVAGVLNIPAVSDVAPDPDAVPKSG